MEIRKEDIESLKPGVGRVLVEIESITSNQVSLSSGVDIWLNHKSDESIVDFSARYGRVVSFSDVSDIPSLCYCWDSPVELRAGDNVFFTRDAIAKVAASNNDLAYYFTTDDNRSFVVIPYKEIILRERDGEYMCLNDYVVVNRVMKDKPSFLEHSIEEPEPFIYDVTFIPSGDIRYDFDPMRMRSNWHKVGVSKGDRIKTRPFNPVKLENDYNRKLDSGLYFFQSHIILAKVDDGE